MIGLTEGRMMPEVEDRTMHLAGLFKIPVCRHTLPKDTDGTLVYLVDSKYKISFYIAEAVKDMNVK